jgi:hypothetical protein
MSPKELRLCQMKNESLVQIRWLERRRDTRHRHHGVGAMNRGSLERFNPTSETNSV